MSNNTAKSHISQPYNSLESAFSALVLAIVQQSQSGISIDTVLKQSFCRGSIAEKKALKIIDRLASSHQVLIEIAANGAIVLKPLNGQVRQ